MYAYSAHFGRLRAGRSPAARAKWFAHANLRACTTGPGTRIIKLVVLSFKASI